MSSCLKYDGEFRLILKAPLFEQDSNRINFHVIFALSLNRLEYFKIQRVAISGESDFSSLIPVITFSSCSWWHSKCSFSFQEEASFKRWTSWVRSHLQLALFYFSLWEALLFHPSSLFRVYKLLKYPFYSSHSISSKRSSISLIYCPTERKKHALTEKYLFFRSHFLPQSSVGHCR